MKINIKYNQIIFISTRVLISSAVVIFAIGLCNFLLGHFHTRISDASSAFLFGFMYCLTMIALLACALSVITISVSWILKK